MTKSKHPELDEDEKVGGGSGFTAFTSDIPFVDIEKNVWDDYRDMT